MGKLSSISLASCLLWAGLAGGLLAEGAEERSSTEILRGELAAFTTSPEAIALTKRQLRALESDDYAERRAAMASLVGATGLTTLLAEDEIRLTEEGRVAMKIVNEAQAERDDEERLRLLMRRIHMQAVPGLAGEVLDAWEGREVTNGASASLSRDAMKTTMRGADRERLVRGTRSATPMVRELSLVGLQRILLDQKQVDDLLESLCQDPVEAVRLEVAILGALHEKRASLTLFAGLLDSEVFHIRNQSHNILAALTEQDMGYYSDGSLKDRQTAASLWQRWAAKFGPKAPIRFHTMHEWLAEGDAYE